MTLLLHIVSDLLKLYGGYHTWRLARLPIIGRMAGAEIAHRHRQRDQSKFRQSKHSVVVPELSQCNPDLPYWLEMGPKACANQLAVGSRKKRKHWPSLRNLLVD